MVTKTKSFLPAVALGFGLLFFGPAMSDAQAQHGRGHGDFRGGVGRHGNFQENFHGGGHRRHFLVGRHFRSRPYFRHSRPFYGGFYAQHRPYRRVRVFVYDPFPRWVVRRVYYDARYADGYCPY